MQFLVVLVLALIAVSSAFSVAPKVRASSRLMSMKKESSFNLALPAAVMPFVAPFAAQAAEGTGLAFGIDDGRLVWAALLPSFILFPLYLQWSSQQEGDDFFDGYEKRRQG